jgi:hypothetical protein
MSIASVCLIVAVILCALACFGVGSPRFALGWGGVAFVALGLLLGSGIVH